MFSKSSVPTKESTQLKKILIQPSESFLGLILSTGLSKFSLLGQDPLYKIPSIPAAYFSIFIEESECLYADQVKILNFFDNLHENSPFKSGSHCEAKSSVFCGKIQHLAPNNSLCLSSLGDISFESCDKPFNLAEELAKEKNNLLNLSTGQGPTKKSCFKYGAIHPEQLYFNSVSSINASEAKDSLIEPIINFSNLELSADGESHRLYQKLSDHTEIVSNEEAAYTGTNESWKKGQVAELVYENDYENSVSLYKSVEALKQAKLIPPVIEEDPNFSIDDEGPILPGPGRSFLNGNTASKAKLSGHPQLSHVITPLLPKNLIDSDDPVLSTIPETAKPLCFPDNSSPILKKLSIVHYKSHNSSYVYSLIPTTGFNSSLAVEFSCEDSKSRLFSSKENLDKNIWFGLMNVPSLMLLEKTLILWLSAGFEHMAACSSSGKVFTWGYGASGCLGHGDKTSLTSPKMISSLDPVKFVYLECGGYHNAAISEEGDVWLWGRGDVNQLGTDLFNLVKDEVGFVALNPIRLSDLKKFNIKIVDLACGEAHTLLLDSEGTVFSFGWNDDGQLGAEEPNSSFSIVKNVNVVEGISGKVVKVSAGAIFSACLNEKGFVWVWGNGDQGQLGLGASQKGSKVPIQISSLSEEFVIDLVCGESSMTCLTSSGKVFAWGQGLAGFFYDQSVYPFGSEIVCFAPRNILNIKSVQEYLIGFRNYE